MSTERSREERWASEAAYFDAHQYSHEAIRPEILERYVQCRQREYFILEYFFFLLKDVKGKRVLDLGCGDGGSAIQLALAGASVVGIDISEKAIEAARIRAAKHGVSHLTEFTATPFEKFRTSQKFDVIAGQAILHHLIPELDGMMEMLRGLAIPGAFCIFIEPVNLSPALRKLRLLLPVAPDSTPDERPLEQSELEILSRHLDHMKLRQFQILARFVRFFLRGPYEFAPPLTRTLCDLLTRTDRLMIEGMGLRKFAAAAVISGNLK